MRLFPYHHLRRTSSPSHEIIALAEAKLFLRVDGNEDDVFISELIVAVRHYAESYLGRSLVAQEWYVEYRDIATRQLFLPMEPVENIQQVTVYDIYGNATLIPPGNYQLFYPDELLFSETIHAERLGITYQSAEEEDNQQDIRQAMLHHLALCFDMRETSAPLPAQAQQMYNQRRKIKI